ncbi:MAG: thioredoxin domain-containing protein, partial [Myxococcales bacterium]
MSADRPVNRLASEPSLYLRQHGHNPVDWYPWSDEARTRSRNENKPILLSIGYSSCHWCHVMERESFENDRIAACMNELFVSIKVDREERPDLDSIYMKAVQMMTGHGGWPMTVFLTPDLEPFYAGTYFPPVDRGGMPGFEKVLLGVANGWRERGDQVRESAAEITRRLNSLARISGSASALNAADVEAAAESLAGIMDRDHGGFGNAPQFAPKFPGTLCLSFLIGAGRVGTAPVREELVRTALDRMADGGIHDQLAGGFHRYSVDRTWLVPHFEKMLYDQALLADVYAEAWLAFGDERYGCVAEGVLDYVARELRSPDGGFYANQDADSNGVEGEYFVWTREEVAAVVVEADVDLVCSYFDVTDGGNFEGKSILRCVLGRDAIDKIGARYGRLPADAAAAIDAARTVLLERRSRRVRPATDKKIVTDWNGL